jgi:hypothetical protein
VKRKLEEDETMETGDADDNGTLNPFSKQGETQSRAGKRKVVSGNAAAVLCFYTTFCLEVIVTIL